MHVKCVSTKLHTRLQNEQGKTCGEVARGRGERTCWGNSFVDRAMNLSRGENSEMRLVGWSVGHLRTRTRFSAMGVR